MRKYSFLIVVAVAALLVTAACGGAATPAAAPTQPPQAVATEVPQPTAVPQPTTAPQPTEAPAPTQAPAAGAAKTLTLWHGWTGTEADTLAELIKTFQAANPGVTVNSLAVPFDQLKNKFTTEASTGGGPDLLIGPKDWIGELAQANLIAPLDDLASQVGLDQLNQSAVDANKFEGKVWAFPESTEAVALWYNKDKVPTPPKDTDELINLASKVGLAYNTQFYNSVGLLLGSGGKLFDENGKCVMDQGTAVADALALIAKIKATPNVIADTDGSKLDAAFKDGQVGMAFNGPWATGDYVKALGADKLGIADPIDLKPGPGKFSPFLGTKNIFLSANSQGDAKTEALAFLKFMSQPDTQGMLAKIGHIPSNPAVKIDDPIQNGFLKQTQVSSYFPNEPEMGAVWTPAGDMITKVIEGKATPADAVKEACATINAANKK